MNLMRANEAKVGLFVVLVGSFTAFLAIKIGDNPHFFRRGQDAHFFISDANGLVRGSQIKTAGIPAGTIREVSIENGLARVDISVTLDQPLTTSASVRIKSQGILGDKYVDLNPGSITDPPLERGGRITMVRETGALDSVIGQVGEIAENLKLVSKNLSEAIAGEGTEDHVIGRITRNIEKLTADLSTFTSDNRDKINTIVDQILSVSSSLNQLLNESGSESFKNRIQTATSRLDRSLANIEEITEKINRGEGTVGKLISDEETAEKVSNAIDGVNDFLGGASSMLTGLEFESRYLAHIGKAKTMVGVRLQPGLDRYYYLGIVDDPAGVVEVIDTRTTTGGNTVVVSEEKTYRNKLKFNIWIAKNFYDLTIRAGLFESSGGLGFDYHFLNRELVWSVEAFEFSKLNLRSQLRYQIWQGIFVTAGIEDVFNRSSKYSNYLGAGLFLTNDDLKLLLTRLPI
jgi:phospholipid/cholesterol/gamma-HCH transport system substrate-binding protein